MSYQSIKEIKLSDLFKESFKVLASNFKDILLIVLIIYLPINILLYLMGSNDMSITQFNKINRWLELLIGIVAEIAIILIVKEAYLNNTKLGFKAALSKALKKWGDSVMTNFIQGIILIFMTILLVIPGLIWFIYYTFALQVVVLVGLEKKDALDYSKGLVKGNWWKVFGFVILTWLFALILGFLFQIPFAFLEGILPSYINVISDTIIDFITVFFVVIPTTIFFLRIEGTREDIDVIDAAANEQD